MTASIKIRALDRKSQAIQRQIGKLQAKLVSLEVRRSKLSMKDTLAALARQKP